MRTRWTSQSSPRGTRNVISAARPSLAVSKTVYPSPWRQRYRSRDLSAGWNVGLQAGFPSSFM